MNNSDIEQVENKVKELTVELKQFSPKLRSRTFGNRNHLGTLDVNLKELRRTIDKLVVSLGY